jgi:hypothetical protein
LNDASVWLGSSAGPRPFLNTSIDEHALSINMKLHVFFAIENRKHRRYAIIFPTDQRFTKLRIIFFISDIYPDFSAHSPRYSGKGLTSWRTIHVLKPLRDMCKIK